jgi:hypothetical protein
LFEKNKIEKKKFSSVVHELKTPPSQWQNRKSIVTYVLTPSLSLSLTRNLTLTHLYSASLSLNLTLTHPQPLPLLGRLSLFPRQVKHNPSLSVIFLGFRFFGKFWFGKFELLNLCGYVQVKRNLCVVFCIVKIHDQSHFLPVVGARFLGILFYHSFSLFY